MLRQPMFAYSKGLFYRIWLVICCLIIIATVGSSFLVYIQISSQLKVHIEQRLLWEANYYRYQMEESFRQVALKLDGLVRSEAAIRVNYGLLQNEMENMRIQSPSVIRSWLAYPDGVLIPSTFTRPEYATSLPWWKEYLGGHTSEAFMGYLLSRSQSLIGKPYLNQSELTTVIPLLSIGLEGSKIIRAAGAEVELNQILTAASGVNKDWSDILVSVYTLDGLMVVCPYPYRERITTLNKYSRHPLIAKMRQDPNGLSGFEIYDYDKGKLAGVFLKVPSLGLVLTLEYPATEVVDPIRRIAYGPLLVAALLVVVAAILMITIHSNTKRLRGVEELARVAELRALQACINPHFLFNTMNCLVGFAVSTGHSALVKMIRALINIFEYTVRNMDGLVSLREELDYLREYVWIQQVRFGERFCFNLSVPEPLLKTKIFKFCIQPLVENCFIHGVEKSLDPVSIEIKVCQDDGDILITVSDNGPGLAPERLAAIVENLTIDTCQTGKSGDGIGLSNIHHRLRHAFGSAYGIGLQPLDTGLTVQLKFPRID